MKKLLLLLFAGLLFFPTFSSAQNDYAEISFVYEGTNDPVTEGAIKAFQYCHSLEYQEMNPNGDTMLFEPIDPNKTIHFKYHDDQGNYQIIHVEPGETIAELEDERAQNEVQSGATSSKELLLNFGIQAFVNCGPKQKPSFAGSHQNTSGGNFAGR